MRIKFAYASQNSILRPRQPNDRKVARCIVLVHQPYPFVAAYGRSRGRSAKPSESRWCIGLVHQPSLLRRCRRTAGLGRSPWYPDRIQEPISELDASLVSASATDYLQAKIWFQHVWIWMVQLKSSARDSKSGKAALSEWIRSNGARGGSI
jgi:hypothetical protein